MSEYLAPGVFVEEVSFRSKSIEGVGTSVCGMVGPTRFGPVRGIPEVLTSYGEFEKIFGDPQPLNLKKDGNSIKVPNYTALAARAFFENGGKQLYLTRVIAGGNDSDEYGSNATAKVASASVASGRIRFDARYPGSGGNLDLLVVWQDQENLIRSRSFSKFSDIPLNAEGLVTFTNLGKQVNLDEDPELEDVFVGTVGHDNAKFPLKTFQALVKKTANGFQFLASTNAKVTNTNNTVESVAASQFGTDIVSAAINAIPFEFKQTYISTPVTGKLDASTPCEMVLSSASDLRAFFNINTSITRLRGTINADGSTFTTSVDDGDAATDDTKVIPITVFSAFPGLVKSFKLQRNFSLQAIRRKTTLQDSIGMPGTGEPVYASPVLSLDKSQANFIGTILTRDPEKTLDKLTIPLVCSVTDGSTSELFADLCKLFVDQVGSGGNIKKVLNPDTSVKDPRHVIVLSGGEDGDFPAAIDYAGEIDDKGSTGFSALEHVEDVSIVATPSAVIDSSRHQSIAVELEKHCVKMRYRFGLVDTREDMSLSEIQTFRNNFDNSRLALYAPWVVVSDPTGEKDTINLPASGFMAGIYARTDVERGVHKAPANTPVLGALRFTQNINKFQQELLNPRGINCLRSFSGRGHQVWGGRTLSSDPEWKYVNVRRYFLYLERSIEKGTQWAVFEPNGDRLWANVVTTVESFLFNEWKNGRLLGAKPSDAYFVRCDRTTMSQNDLDNGRLICEIGVAPLTPAEFVIFRIGQKTADA